MKNLPLQTVFPCKLIASRQYAGFFNQPQIIIWRNKTKLVNFQLEALIADLNHGFFRNPIYLAG
jgi:hypothetical protein